MVFLVIRIEKKLPNPLSSSASEERRLSWGVFPDVPELQEQIFSVSLSTFFCMEYRPQKFKYSKSDTECIQWPVQIPNFLNFILALSSVAIFCVYFKQLCWHNKDDGMVDNPNLIAFLNDYKLVEMHATSRNGNVATCSVASFSD